MVVFIISWLLTTGIYKCTFSHKKLGIPKEHLATKSLPHLVSLSIDNNLNLNQVLHRQTHFTHLLFELLFICSVSLIRLLFQFNSFMVVIREMLSRMETEHKTKLEQLHIMQEQQRSMHAHSF